MIKLMPYVFLNGKRNNHNFKVIIYNNYVVDKTTIKIKN